VLVLTCATLIAYWPALSAGFIWDDDVILTSNPLVKADQGLYRMWFTLESVDYWPVTGSSFWLEWRLWGMRASGYHLSNVLQHIASALLVWLVLHKLSIPGAWIAACLFALHPVNVESVAWITQRKNTLSQIFLLLSIVWFIRYDTRLRGPNAAGR
jgi:protein O-mannosyl-transferase